MFTSVVRRSDHSGRAESPGVMFGTPSFYPRCPHVGTRRSSEGRGTLLPLPSEHVHRVEGNWPDRSGVDRTHDLVDVDTAKQDDDEDPQDGARVAELSFAEKYADAFWRLVPIPALVVADGVALARHPSAPGVAALVLLALVGSFVEVIIWNRLRLRWQRGLDPESVGRLYEPNHRLELVLLVILWLAAFTWKASGVAERFSDVLITVLIGVLVFGGAIAVDLVRRGRS